MRSRFWVAGFDLAVNVAVPVLVYRLTHERWGDVASLLAASVPPLLWSIGGFLRFRRLDALSILVLAGIALSLVAVTAGGSARMLALREKMATLLIGLAFLGSAAIGRPLVGPLARATLSRAAWVVPRNSAYCPKEGEQDGVGESTPSCSARRSAEALATFEARREDASVRHTILVMTLVWGFGLLADAAVSALLIYTVSIADYLLIGPFIGYGTIGALALWTGAYRRWRRAAAIAQGGSATEP